MVPIEARWSKSQTWSNPASSAMRHTARSASIVVSCPESFRPKRNGCFIPVRLPSAERSRPDAQRDVVVAAEPLRLPAVALDQACVLADVFRHPMGRRLAPEPFRIAIDAQNVPAVRRGVEVKRHLWVGFDVPDLLARQRVDEEGLPVPEEPHRYRVRPPV